MDILSRSGARILFPSEYDKFRSGMKPNYQIISDALLMTGLRPIEFWRMDRSWYRAARRCLEVPVGACMKEKCQQKQRTVILSLPGCEAIERFLNANIKPLKENSMRDSFIRAAIRSGIGPEYITSKMFRKTWVSWLVACYPERGLEIAASMGHSVETMRTNYLGLAFPRAELDIARNLYLTGWGVI